MCFISNKTFLRLNLLFSFPLVRFLYKSDFSQIIKLNTLYDKVDKRQTHWSSSLIVVFQRI